jgi:acetoin utilization deacetylase AcuC-like enzyme
MLTIAYDPIYAHPLPEGHRFRMLKYELIPGQLLHEGVITEANIFSPEPLAEEIILRTHNADYWQRMKCGELNAKEMRAIGFPPSPMLVEREIRISKGTIDCALNAIQYGVSLNVAGGTHHAFAGHGEGFCLLNDFALASNYLLDNELANKILIVDLDVHQGNGTASIFQHDDRVFTFSIHGEHNYPFHKEKSNLDIGLADDTNGNAYLRILEKTLPELIEQVRPDFICFVAGVDVLATDKFGKMKLTIADCKHRDEIVFSHCKNRHIPVAVSMGGGYSPDIKEIVEAHCNTFKSAKDIFEL